MSRKRLANYERDKIIAAVVEKKIKPLKETLEKEKKELAVKCFNDYLEKKLKGIKIDHFPDGFFPICKCVKICLPGNYDYESDLLSSQYKRVPFDLTEDGYYTHDTIKIKLKNKSDFYFKEFAKLEKERIRITKKETDLRHELNSILYSVTTMSKLLKVWPEVENYIDAREFMSLKDTALIPSVKKLNVMLYELELVVKNSTKVTQK